MPLGPGGTRRGAGDRGSFSKLVPPGRALGAGPGALHPRPPPGGPAQPQTEGWQLEGTAAEV